MPIAIYAGTEEEFREADKSLKLHRLINITQAAAHLGINENRLRLLVKEGALTPYEEDLYGFPLYLAEDISELRRKRLKSKF